MMIALPWHEEHQAYMSDEEAKRFSVRKSERKNTKIDEETLIMLGVIKGYLREPIYRTIHRLVEAELKRVEQAREEDKGMNNV